MKRIVYTGKAKKDMKKIQGDPVRRRLLAEALFKIANGEPLSPAYRPHRLTGNYAGCMECHIQSDFLLVWIDRDIVKVVRVGSHSELF